MTTPSVLQIEHYEQLLQEAETRQRALLNTMELVLTVGDFQKQVDQPTDPRELIRLTAERVNTIIHFDVSAIYVLDQRTAVPELSCCMPEALQDQLTEQFEFLIRHGYIAWALRERRGITVYADNKRHRVLMHTLDTYARIRGIFIGLFPVDAHRLPDGSLQSVSLLLRNAANALESLEYLAMFQRQNAELNTKVDEKVGELRRRDQQLFNARKMDAIATLAGGVAHQYNNALAVLVGSLDLIRIALANGREISNNLEQMENVAHRMQELTAKLLAYARGGIHLPQSIPVEALVKSGLSVARTSPDNPIEVHLGPPAGACAVHVDLTQMQLVLSAIVTNSLEALGTNGRIRIDAQTVSVCEMEQETCMELSPGDYVVLRFQDNGRGMDESTRQQIFEPFFTTKFPGRGLSMAAACGIIRNHHGGITVESKLGQGTTVRVYLPIASQD